ncbi:MAG TPA: NAD(P)-dependent oxidoreductase [Candidatus Binatia bacterium]|jgi:3-hydroxyisobutyrate dehydrogenase-like beta-hydroxyacid dehydrogenase
MTKVGFIGLGNMGKPLATNIAQAGFDLMVYDRREQPMKELAATGAKTAGSAADVGKHGEVIGLAVVDDEQVEEVTLGDGGLMSSAKPGTVIAVHSTIHPRTVRKLADILKAKGIGLVDAQMSGGSAGAKDKTLCFMVGGESPLFEKCRPVLEASGKHIFHMGAVGTGATAKLAQQTMVVVNILSAYEGMSLAQKAGIDPEVFQELVRVSAGQSRMADNWLKFSDKTGKDPHMVELFFKGVCPAVEMAHELGLPVPGLALAQQLLARIFEGKISNG